MDNVITVYNKADKEHEEFLKENAILTSARSGLGLDALLATLDQLRSQRMASVDLLLPYDKVSLINTIRESGTVQLEEYTADGIHVKGLVDKKLLYIFNSYLI